MKFTVRRFLIKLLLLLSYDISMETEFIELYSELHVYLLIYNEYIYDNKCIVKKLKCTKLRNTLVYYLAFKIKTMLLVPAFKP